MTLTLFQNALLLRQMQGLKACPPDPWFNRFARWVEILSLLFWEPSWDQQLVWAAGAACFNWGFIARRMGRHCTL